MTGKMLGRAVGRLHVDRYKIDWANQRIVADGRSADPRLFGCYDHGHSYVHYTRPHRNGECGRFAPQASPSWPVVPPKEP